MKENKKGVSSVILSTLLILIVVILVAIIAITMRTLTTGVEQATYKTQCDLENPGNIEAAEACILAKMGKEPENNKNDKTDSNIDYSLYTYAVYENGQIIYYNNKPNNLEIDGYILELKEEPILVLENNEREKARELKNEGKSDEANKILNDIESKKINQKEKIEIEQNKLIEDLKQRVGKEKTSKDVRDFNTLKIDREYSDLINAISLDIDYIEMLKIKDSPLIKEIYPNTKYELNLEDSVSLINADNNYQNSVSGLVLWLKGEDNANNEIGYKNGIMNGGVSFSEGRQGRGFSFDGINDYIEIPYYQNLNNDQYSLSFWIRSPDELISDPYASQFTIVRLASNNKGYVFATSLSNHIRAFNLIDAGINANLDFRSGKIDGGYYTDKNWHHVVQVRNENKNILYVDGVKKYEGLRSFSDFSDSNTSLFIGGLINQYGNTGGHFKGEMDEIMLFSRAINQNEVSKLYNLENFGNKYTGKDVKIAILDSGVDYTHFDFGGCFGDSCKVIYGWDYVNNDANPMDDHGHGTHVASIAAGKGKLNGVAPDAKILAYKVLSSGGTGSTTNILSAIENATLTGANIISMSLGNNCLGSYSNICGPDDIVSKALDNVVNSGISVVVSSGNSGSLNSTISSPATSRNAISVGATYKKNYIGSYYADINPIKNQITSFSSRGPVIYNGNEYIAKPDIVAPGAVICAAQWANAWSSSECIDNEHTAISGTSMSAPHVSGAIALIKEAHPELDALQIKSLIKHTAKDLNYPLEIQGFGLIDVNKAIDFEGNTLFSNINGVVIITNKTNITGEAYGEGFSNYSLYVSQNDGESWNLIKNGYNQIFGSNNILYENFDGSIYYEGKITFKLVVRDLYGKEFESFMNSNIMNLYVNQSLNKKIIRREEGFEINGYVEGQINDISVIHKLKEDQTYSNNGVEISAFGAGEYNYVTNFARVNTNNFLAGEYEFIVNVLVGNIYKNQSFSSYIIESLKEGWPRNLIYNNDYSHLDNYRTFLSEDLNNDNKKEIIYLDQNATLHVLDNFGNEMQGWPKHNFYGSYNSFSGYSVADVNNDNKKEILLTQYYVPKNFNNNVEIPSKISILDINGNNVISPIVFPSDFHAPGLNLMGTKTYSYEPHVYDIDKDGQNEIITAFSHQGFTSTDYTSYSYIGIAIYSLDGNREQIIKFPTSILQAFYGGVGIGAIGDVDNNGINDIIVKCFGYISNQCVLGRDMKIYNYSGYQIGGSDFTKGSMYSRAVISDLNTDNQKEIIYMSYNTSNLSSTNHDLYVRNSLGELLFRKQNVINFAIGDLNKDNNNELYVISYEYRDNSYYYNINKYNVFGENINDFNYETNDIIKTIYITDVNNDNLAEIIILKQNKNLEIIDMYGNQLMGLLANNPYIGNILAITLKDIDNDGKGELIEFVQTPYNKFYSIVFETDINYSPINNQWPLFIEKPANPTCFNC